MTENRGPDPTPADNREPDPKPPEDDIRWLIYLAIGLVAFIARVAWSTPPGAVEDGGLLPRVARGAPTPSRDQVVPA